jgi:hypothetical protein
MTEKLTKKIIDRRPSWQSGFSPSMACGGLISWTGRDRARRLPCNRFASARRSNISGLTTISLATA